MRIPSTLRLPFWAAARFRLEAILASQAVDRGLREVFALSGPELAFARALLARTRMWLYRTNQRHACGDFVVIDMSAPRDRTAYALELKSDEPVRPGAGGLQLAGLDAAIAELRPILGDGEVITARGGASAMLAWLGR